MHTPRRRDLLTAAGYGGAAMLFGCGPGGETKFPQRDITFIIPFAPGGGFDSYVRVMLEPMQRFLPQRANIVPLNVEGAGGGKATSQLFHARPDGYTISVVSVPGAIVLQQLQGKSGYDLGKMSWLGNMGSDPYGIAVGVNSPIKSVDDLRALSKRRPVKFTSTGPGSTGRAGTLISSAMLGIRSEIIAGYKGTSEYLVAAARGDGDAAVCSLTAMQGLAKAKVIRIIASFEQHSTLPGVPDATTLGQPDLVQISQLRPVAGPPNLPKKVHAILSDALDKALHSPTVTDWAQKNGASLTWATPEQTTQLIQQQTAFISHWKKMLGDKL
ncbi:MAG: tripartite tricarboxylate transporter substrate-binding protein [Caulobacteraceae bacterium]